MVLDNPCHRQRPGLDKVAQCRQIICVWSRSMKACCEQDLQPDDFKQVAGVIEEGDILDDQASKMV